MPRSYGGVWTTLEMADASGWRTGANGALRMRSATEGFNVRVCEGFREFLRVFGWA